MEGLPEVIWTNMERAYLQCKLPQGASYNTGHLFKREILGDFAKRCTGILCKEMSLNIGAALKSAYMDRCLFKYFSTSRLMTGSSLIFPYSC